MVNLIFWTIIILLLLSFAGDEYLSYLNASYRNKKIPPELQDIYDKEKYLKSQRYAKTKRQFAFLKNSFDLVLILLMVAFGGFGYLNALIQSDFENIIIITLLFFGILIFASDLLSLPFSLYNTFVIEERFGFNTTSPKTFITDKLKSWLLLIIIGGGIISLIVWIYQHLGENFWLPAWIFISLFSIFTGMFYSTLIVPLFNKQKPLEEGELRTAIEKFADKAGFDLKNIYVIDGSKRSKKANAYFTGLGKKKRIVLFDTLIEELETDEIVAVLAHETGHYKKKHIYKSMMLSILQTGLMLFILSLFIESKSLSQALGASDKSFAVNLVAFGILYSPISFILGLYGNIKSRKHEYEADRFAKNYDFDEALISGLKKLSSKNLSNLTPHPAYVYFYYSHPPLYERIKALKNE
jgi:STE24 endopeptidase